MKPDQINTSSLTQKVGLERRKDIVRSAAEDASVTVAGYLAFIKAATNDEEMHNMLKDILESNPIESYVDYLKRTDPGMKEEIDHYYPKYGAMVKHIAERLIATDSSKNELIDLFDKLREYIKKKN